MLPIVECGGPELEVRRVKWQKLQALAATLLFSFPLLPPDSVMKSTIGGGKEALKKKPVAAQGIKR